MRFLKNHKVKIGKHTFYIRITNRAIIEYEDLSKDKNMDFSSIGNMLKFFYCTAKAGAKSEKVKFEFTYDEFLDMLNDYYAETIESFQKVMMDEVPEGEKKSLVETQESR